MARKRCQLAAAGWGTLPSTEREKLHYILDYIYRECFILFH